jgi:antitoxin component YwqK of YwqJK toxin-antitoxin module
LECEFISYYENTYFLDNYVNKRKISLKCYYKEGKKEGEYSTYYENGQMNIKCNYYNDEINGEYNKYNERSGRLVMKCNYNNGVKKRMRM